MLLALLVALCLAAAPELRVASGPDPCESLVIAQVREVLTRIHKAEKGISTTDGFTVAYEGTVSIEAHVMHPGDLVKRAARLEIAAAGDRLRVREASGGGRAQQLETTIVRDGRVAQQKGADGPFRELTDGRGGAIGSAVRWFPTTAARAASARASTCRPGPSVGAEGVAFTPVSWASASGEACTLLLDPQDRVGRIESLAADPRLGDTCEWTAFDDWQDRAGATVPGRIRRFVVLAGSTLTYELSLVDFALSPSADSFDLPPNHRADIADWSEGKSPLRGMEFVNLGAGLWSLEVGASNSRVLVIERASDLALLEAPDGDAVCSAIVSALNAKFPGKRVSVVAVGHHHPASSGGLRAVSSSGAMIVAPEVLHSFVDSLLARPVTLGAPAVLAPEHPAIECFQGERTIDAGDATVRLIDIGERSAHAFSYTVFYFPRLGLLFEGDLGYFPLEGEPRVGERLRGLAAELERLNIAPTRLVQAWPVQGVRREVEWRSVIDVLRAAPVGK